MDTSSTEVKPDLPMKNSDLHKLYDAEKCENEVTQYIVSFISHAASRGWRNCECSDAELDKIARVNLNNVINKIRIKFPEIIIKREGYEYSTYRIIFSWT